MELYNNINNERICCSEVTISLTITFINMKIEWVFIRERPSDSKRVRHPDHDQQRHAFSQLIIFFNTTNVKDAIISKTKSIKSWLQPSSSHSCSSPFQQGTFCAIKTASCVIGQRPACTKHNIDVLDSIESTQSFKTIQQSILCCKKENSMLISSQPRQITPVHRSPDKTPLDFNRYEQYLQNGMCFYRDEGPSPLTHREALITLPRYTFGPHRLRIQSAEQ